MIIIEGVTETITGEYDFKSWEYNSLTKEQLLNAINNDGFLEIQVLDDISTIVTITKYHHYSIISTQERRVIIKNSYLNDFIVKALY